MEAAGEGAEGVVGDFGGGGGVDGGGFGGAVEEGPVGFG
jgi:hypothetical protein